MSNDDDDFEVSELHYIWSKAPDYDAVLKSTTCGSLDKLLAELKLTGFTIVHIVDDDELMRRRNFSSTNSMHARKRLRTLQHWQRR